MHGHQPPPTRARARLVAFRLRRARHVRTGWRSFTGRTTAGRTVAGTWNGIDLCPWHGATQKLEPPSTPSSLGTNTCGMFELIGGTVGRSEEHTSELQSP